MSGSFSFPPPSSGGLGAPPPPVDPGHEVVVVPSTPPRRRTGRIVGGVVAVVALGAGVVAIVVARAGDDSTERSLDAALAAAVDAESAAYRATVELGGDQVISIDAAVDEATERTRLDATFGLPGLGAGGGEASLSMVTDGASDSVYFEAGDLVPFLPSEWVRLGVAQLSDLVDQDLGDLSAQFGVSPLDTADLLASGDAVEVGPTEIDGEAVTQFQVTLDTSELLADLPGIVEQPGGAVPDELVYDVYVADGSELRRVELEIEAVGAVLRTVVDVEQLGEPVDIELPTDVTDLGDLGGLVDGLLDGLGGGLFGD
jgi:hypothetical protein